jgi:hypothetical protein
LEIYCFTDTKCKYGGNIVRRHNSESVNATSTPRKTKKAHPTYTSGPSTTMAVLQVHQETHQAKAVARPARQGATAPRVRLNPPFLWQFINAMQSWFSIVS